MWNTPQDVVGWVWLGLVGFGWIWLGMVGFGWVWLGLVGFGWVCILVPALEIYENVKKIRLCKK